MKRLEWIIAAVVVVLVIGGMAALFTIPRPPADVPSARLNPDGPGASKGGAADPMDDPARKLWAADPERSVYVFGEAGRPGAHGIPPDQDWTVRDLLSVMEGVKTEAEGRIRVMRKVNGAVTQVLELSRDQLETATDAILPGDVVYVD